MFEEDLTPKNTKKPVHEIGQDLTPLSVKEIGERIEILKQEIARLESAKTSKSGVRMAADAIFKS